MRFGLQVQFHSPEACRVRSSSKINSKQENPNISQQIVLYSTECSPEVLQMLSIQNCYHNLAHKSYCNNKSQSDYLFKTLSFFCIKRNKNLSFRSKYVSSCFLLFILKHSALRRLTKYVFFFANGFHSRCGKRFKVLLVLSQCNM